MTPILIDQNIPIRVRDWLKQKGFETAILADLPEQSLGVLLRKLFSSNACQRNETVT